MAELLYQPIKIDGELPEKITVQTRISDKHIQKNKPLSAPFVGDDAIVNSSCVYDYMILTVILVVIIILLFNVIRWICFDSTGFRGAEINCTKIQQIKVKNI
jgi:ABC-type Mn2+/Zn2+ transport system permease subunit